MGKKPDPHPEPETIEASYEYQCRKKMVQFVSYILHKSNLRDPAFSNATKDNDYLKKLVKQAKHIELLLYHDATSFKEYIDTSTLLQRLSSVVKNNSAAVVVGDIHNDKNNIIDESDVDHNDILLSDDLSDKFD